MEPDHFYVALWKEQDISQTTDTEPRYQSYYRIMQGPYSGVMEAWEDAWLSDQEWDEACVLGFKGVVAIHAYHTLMNDTVTQDALEQGPAEDALREKISMQW